MKIKIIIIIKQGGINKKMNKNLSSKSKNKEENRKNSATLYSIKL